MDMESRNERHGTFGTAAVGGLIGSGILGLLRGCGGNNGGGGCGGINGGIGGPERGTPEVCGGSLTTHRGRSAEDGGTADHPPVPPVHGAGACAAARSTDFRDADTPGGYACGSLLEEIRAVEFSLYETALFLDAYPADTQALALYHRLKDERGALIARYEREIGPLTHLGNVSNRRWEWVDKPFPWEADADR